MSKLYDDYGGHLRIDNERTRENLLQFADKIRDDLEDEQVQIYAWAVRQASNSIRSRQRREDALKALIVVERNDNT